MMIMLSELSSLVITHKQRVKSDVNTFPVSIASSQSNLGENHAEAVLTEIAATRPVPTETQIPILPTALGSKDLIYQSSTKSHLHATTSHAASDTAKGASIPALDKTPSEIASVLADADPVIDVTPEEEMSLILDGGNTYEGLVQQDLMHGKGQFTWRDGVTYTGDFSQNTISGTGEYRWNNGDVYRGEVLNAFRHGMGTYCLHDSTTQYAGAWKRGEMDGEGVLTYDDITQQSSRPTTKHQASYKGSWVANKKHGYGVMTYPSGNEYAGSWVQGRKEGHGIMRWLDRHESYEGEWTNDLPHGTGTYTWHKAAHLQSDLFPLRNTYTGEWKEGLRHGMGKFVYASGAWYEGEWAENRKHGAGVYLSEDGLKQTGVWVNDHFKPTTRGDPAKRLTDCHFVFADLSAEEQSEVNAVIFRHLSTLRKLYQTYTPGAGKAPPMKKRQLWRLLQDIPTLRLCGVSLVELDRAIAAPYQNDPDLHERFVKMHDPNLPFVFHNFLDALIRVAHRIYAQSWTQTLPPSAYESPMTCAVSSFLTQHLLEAFPRGDGPTSLQKSITQHTHSTPTFKGDFLGQVDDRFGGRLATMYHDFARVREGQSFPDAEDATMTCREFLFLLAEHSLLAPDTMTGSATPLSVGDVTGVFEGSVAAINDGGGACNLEFELTSVEFTQAWAEVVFLMEARAFGGGKGGWVGPVPLLVQGNRTTVPPVALSNPALASLLRSSSNLAAVEKQSAQGKAGAVPEDKLHAFQENCFALLERVLVSHERGRASPAA